MESAQTHQRSKQWKIGLGLISEGSQKFLGLCSYYQKFVNGFATIAKPLHELTQKDKAFFWLEACQSAFEGLKIALISTPILAYYDAEGDLILDTDASGVGLEAVLSQLQEGSEWVITNYSRTLSQPERQYCVTQRKLLALLQWNSFTHIFMATRWLWGRIMEPCTGCWISRTRKVRWYVGWEI